MAGEAANRDWRECVGGIPARRPEDAPCMKHWGLNTGAHAWLYFLLYKSPDSKCVLVYWGNLRQIRKYIGVFYSGFTCSMMLVDVRALLYLTLFFIVSTDTGRNFKADCLIQTKIKKRSERRKTCALAVVRRRNC